MKPEILRSETILLVEDEAFVREVSCEILRSAGYTVLGATNATEAQYIFFRCSAEIKLLLTDIVLPGDSGRVLAAKLKQSCPSLKILFATGYPEQMNSGVDCLAKPFSAATLLNNVSRILGHQQAEFYGEIPATRACRNAQLPGCVQEYPAAALCG